MKVVVFDQRSVLKQLSYLELAIPSAIRSYPVTDCRVSDQFTTKRAIDATF